jgi:acetoacetyl-CoA synthetase
MPVHLWNDPDAVRYTESYFDAWPGVWRHGDWVTMHSDGSVSIHGRSDSTLNRQGVRLGSSDFYDVLETLPEITEPWSSVWSCPTTATGWACSSCRHPATRWTTS